MSESVAPTVDNVSSDNSSGSYTIGSNIIIKVAFSETVFVDNSTGNPKIELETGSTDDNATYISTSDNGSVLYFIYTVGDGDTSADLDYKSTSSLSANSGTIRDNSSNNATLTLPSPGTTGSLGANKAIVIDTTAPIALLISCSKASCLKVPLSGSVTVQSSKAGTAYLVKTSGTGDSIENITHPDNITTALGNMWNEVAISSDNISRDVPLYTTGLVEWGEYRVYAVDALGNLSGRSTETGGLSGALGTFSVKFN